MLKAYTPKHLTVTLFDKPIPVTIGHVGDGIVIFHSQHGMFASIFGTTEKGAEPGKHFIYKDDRNCLCDAKGNAIPVSNEEAEFIRLVKRQMLIHAYAPSDQL